MGRTSDTPKPCHAPHPRPAELLHSPGVATVLDRIEAEYDPSIFLFDMPPMFVSEITHATDEPSGYLRLPEMRLAALLAIFMVWSSSDSRTPPSLPPMVPLPAHGTIVLVSDWLDPLEKIEEIIRYYASVGVRGHLVQILDPAEEELPFDGHVKFEGLEAEGQHTIRRVEAVRAAYGARLAAQKEGLNRLARPANWTVHLHRTDRSPQTVLLSLYLAMADMGRLNMA